MVDDAYRRVEDGTVTVTCGSQRIQGKRVEVPCGGEGVDVDGHTAERRKLNVGLAGCFHGGVGQRKLFTRSVLGAAFDGGLGLYVDNVDLHFDLQLLFASTSKGLPVRQIQFGTSIDVGCSGECVSGSARHWG